jgi:hypothetical protein
VTWGFGGEHSAQPGLTRNEQVKGSIPFSGSHIAGRLPGGIVGVTDRSDILAEVVAQAVRSCDAGRVTTDALMEVCEGRTASLKTLSRLRGDYLQRGSVHAVFTGLPVPPFNGIDVWRADEDMQQHVRDFVKLGSEQGVPMSISVPVGAPHERDLCALATSLGFAEAGDPQAAMLLSHIDVPPRSADLDVTYSSPGSAEALEAVAGLTSEVFGLPGEVAQVLADPATLTWSDLEWITLERDGRLVAMAMFVEVGSVANVFNVGVPDRHRRRGLGAEATWEAIRRAGERGALRSALFASSMGEPVYSKMGFEIVGRVRTLFHA